VPPLRFLKLPPADGDSWKINSTIDGATLTGTFQVKREDVTVPLRRFEGAFAASTTDTGERPRRPDHDLLVRPRPWPDQADDAIRQYRDDV
jgi:hypothetical protein